MDHIWRKKGNSKIYKIAYLAADILLTGKYKSFIQGRLQINSFIFL